MRRPLRALSPSLLAMLVAIAVSVACSPSDPSTAQPDGAAPPTGEAGTPEAGADAATRPYPPGPYTGAIGETLPNFTVRGYALSREQRDSTKLPFQDVSVAEVRNTPACSCLVVVWSGAGDRCLPCIEGDSAVAAAVTSDPTLCAVEVLRYNFDNVRADEPLQPPTRADLDAYTQAGRQPFPVGLVTPGAFAAFGGRALQGIPSYLFVRTDDMRIAGVQLGTGINIAEQAKALCAKPAPPIENLLTGIRPRKLVVDGVNAFFSDEDKGIMRVPAAGGTAVVLRKPPSTPDAIALDDSNVYWATHDGGTAFEVGQVSKNGGAPITLASGASGYLAIAVDTTDLYFARADGAIGRVAIGGGAETILFTAEAAPTSIGLDDAEVYWLASTTGEVAAGSKTGGATRRTVAPAGTLRPGKKPLEILVAPPTLFIRGLAPLSGDITGIPTAGGAKFLVEGNVTAAFAIDRAPGPKRFVLALGNGEDEAALIATVGANSAREQPVTHMIAQRSVTSVAGDGAYDYWTSNPKDASGGSLRRVRR